MSCDEPIMYHSKGNAIPKVCPLVIRRSGDGLELLAFEHPCGDFQLVKGTVEAVEDLPVAARRELLEEAGIQAESLSPLVARFHATLPHPSGAGEQLQDWHVFLATPEAPLPETWIHAAEGSEEERNLTFRFFWQSPGGALSNYHPVFRRVMAMAERLVAPAPPSAEARLRLLLWEADGDHTRELHPLHPPEEAVPETCLLLHLPDGDHLGEEWNLGDLDRILPQLEAAHARLLDGDEALVSSAILDERRVPYLHFQPRQDAILTTLLFAEDPSLASRFPDEELYAALRSRRYRAFSEGRPRRLPFPRESFLRQLDVECALARALLTTTRFRSHEGSLTLR